LPAPMAYRTEVFSHSVHTCVSRMREGHS
jgi:hypothetical protein